MAVKATKSNETLYWTIGGVVLALLALYAVTKQSGGSASQSTTSSPAIDASSLVSETNQVNSDAAAVEETLLNDETSYATNRTNTSAATLQTSQNDATAQLASIEGAATTRYADTIAGQTAETEANLNVVENEFDATQQTAQNAATNAAQENEVNTATSNEVNAVRASANAAKDSNIFSSIFGGVTSLLGGLFSGGSSVLGSAGTGLPAPGNAYDQTIIPPVATAPAFATPTIAAPENELSGVPTIGIG